MLTVRHDVTFRLLLDRSGVERDVADALVTDGCVGKVNGLINKRGKIDLENSVRSNR
jgi:hypothetical protein